MSLTDDRRGYNPEKPASPFANLLTTRTRESHEHFALIIRTEKSDSNQWLSFRAEVLIYAS